MLRVGPESYESTLAREHAKEMDFTPRAIKRMVYVGSGGIAEDEQLAEWLGLAVAFAGSLPPKGA